MLNSKVQKIVACPQCHRHLDMKDGQLHCQNKKCQAVFKIINNKPVFLKMTKKDSAQNEWTKKKDQIKRSITPLLFYQNRRPELLLKKLRRNKNGPVLNVGSGDVRYEKEDINLDINLYPHVDIVADAHALPIKDASLGLIIGYHVLEHLRDPQLVAQEFYRVLKPGGIIFIEMPFIQRFHGYPDDYYRFTPEGLREILKDFKEVKSGVAGGPTTALIEFIINFLRLLFKNKLLLALALVILSPIIFVIKYLDIILLRRKNAYILASGIYFIGRK